MIDSITLTGIVATDPRHTVTTEGLAVTTFRLASGQRRFDRATNSWVDLDTNWYTVSTFRLLARNVARSVQKGQHVMLTGKLRLREWKTGERSGLTIDVVADSLGHDLNWYVTTAIRTSMTGQTPPNTGPARPLGAEPGLGAEPAAGFVVEPESPAAEGVSDVDADPESAAHAAAVAPSAPAMLAT